MLRNKVAVVGAGIGGIACAIRLASNYEVTVYEASHAPGGKLAEIKNGDYRFDAGPSLFTMPELVEELFLLHSKKASDYFKYERLETLCKYFYEDGTVLNAYADPAAFAKEVNALFNENAESIIKYLKSCHEKYRLTADLFLFNSLSLKSFATSKAFEGLKSIHKLDIFSTLHQLNQARFNDPRLVQLFDRYATYNGSNPYATPGIMSIIPHLEYNMGAYIPDGGMYAIVKSLVKLAEELGVRFEYGRPVQKIVVHNKVATGLQVGGKVYLYDKVISNADIHHTYQVLLKGQKWPHRILKQPKSSSAMVFYWNMKGCFPELKLHNIFFSKDYKAEFEEIFSNNTISSDPTIYVNISSKHCAEDAPENCENWFVMINVPYNQGQDWAKLRKQARANIIQKLNRLLENNIEDYIDGEAYLDPVLIEERTASYGGALYGNSSNNKFAAFLRHANYSSDIKNLYFCGGSVHPGGGIPLCLLSAKIVSELITYD
ncbi:1-hydroxycarotenoid 3,4-desaturase CrtD [Cytophagaceae bacterium ABcell3]|nr:1-hydroxycarotenoid 3,4-desaturase CrtD [Cytophagaceae bacterium ABcell3]